MSVPKLEKFGSVVFSILSEKNIISNWKKPCIEKWDYFQIASKPKMHNAVASTELEYISHVHWHRSSHISRYKRGEQILQLSA